MYVCVLQLMCMLHTARCMSYSSVCVTARYVYVCDTARKHVHVYVCGSSSLRVSLHLLLEDSLPILASLPAQEHARAEAGHAAVPQHLRARLRWCSPPAGLLGCSPAEGAGWGWASR